MSNDLRIGLSCGVACVFAVAILFFQKTPAPSSAAVPPARAATIVIKETPAAPVASIPGGPLPRPTHRSP